jgi:hypothetical protein
MSDYKKILQQEIQALRDRVAGSSLPVELAMKVGKDIVALERSVSLYRLGAPSSLE